MAQPDASAAGDAQPDAAGSSKATRAAGSSADLDPQAGSLPQPKTHRRLLLLVLVPAALLALGLLFWSRPSTVFTREQLAKFNGKDGQPLYLAVLGEVFDVTKGRRHYDGGAGYSGFVGRDASRSFVTGDFVNDLNDDVADFTPEQFAGLIHWRGFFRNHTEYTFQGLVEGAFYDAAGKRQPLLGRVEDQAKLAKSAADRQREVEAAYVKCNARWNAESGGWVWCDDGRYPRKVTLQQPASGQNKIMCACFEGYGWSDVRQVYPNCEAKATECQIAPPKPRTTDKTEL